MAKIMQAAGNITRASFVKVYTSANNQVVAAGANDRTIGIAQIGGRTAPLPSETQDPAYAAQANENLLVHTLDNQRDDVVLQIGSGGCTAGDELKSDASGYGVVAATGTVTRQNIGAIALETASAGELCKVMIVNYCSYPTNAS